MEEAEREHAYALSLEAEERTMVGSTVVTSHVCPASSMHCTRLCASPTGEAARCQAQAARQSRRTQPWRCSHCKPHTHVRLASQFTAHCTEHS